MPPASPSSPPTAARYEDWLHLRLSLFSCYRGKPGSLEARMVPTGLTAWRIYHGTAQSIAGTQRLRAGPGQWLIPPPTPRLHRFSSDIQLLSLNFFAQWPSGEPLFKDGLGLILNARDHPQLEQTALAVDNALENAVLHHDYHVYTHDMPLLEFLTIQRFFIDFFAAFVASLSAHGIEPAPPGKVDPRLAQAITILQRQPLELPLAIHPLAQSVGLSAVHLNRLAVAHLGHTLTQHWEYRRAEYARRCLAVPGTQAKQVGMALGFSTPGHFSRWFDRIHGLSPRQYLQQTQTPSRRRL